MITDNLPNRAYIRVTNAAAATTVVYTTLDTEMGARTGLGWLLTRMDVAPAIVAGIDPGTASRGTRAQLLTGTHTDTVALDDEHAVAHRDWGHSVAGASGMANLDFPKTWLGPVLLAQKKLTALMDSTTADAEINDEIFIFTLWYFWQDMKTAEWIEAQEAKGQF